jgi:very-short-patch-repair endonuclease
MSDKLHASRHIDPAVINAAFDQQVGQLALNEYRDRLKVMGLAKERIDALAAIAHNEILAALPLCDSPIERDLLPWLVTGSYRSIRSSPLPVVRPGRDWATLTMHSAVLWPQFEVGRFRLDFALAVRRHGRHTIIAIECDGAQFHTPSQDGMRDEALAAGGIVTVRSTGSEIRHDPQAVIYRIDEAVLAWAASAEARP